MKDVGSEACFYLAAKVAFCFLPSALHKLVLHEEGQGLALHEGKSVPCNRNSVKGHALVAAMLNLT